MKARHVALAGLGAVWLSGCADPASMTPLGQERRAIVNGVLSDAKDDAVVYVSGPSNGCTGTLIAPDVVLTALHCVTAFDANARFDCQPDGTLAPGSTSGTLGTPLMASMIWASAGVQVDKTKVVYGKALFTTESPEVCRDDLAVLVLESPLDRGDAPLVSLRFNRVTRKGELTRALGFGDTQGTATANGRQERDDVEVLGVGGPNVSTPGDDGVAPRTLLVGPGPCHGDSGGPIFSEVTGAEIGVYSLLNGSTCVGDDVTNVYTQVAPYESLIRMALSSADEEPLVEPPEPEESAGGAGGVTGEAGDTGTAGAVATGGSTASGGTGGSSAGSSGAGSGGKPASAGSGGDTTNGEGASADAADEGNGSGSRRDPSCTCRTAGAPRGSAWDWAALALAGLAVLRRRQRRA